jgi:hypothetical protein
MAPYTLQLADEVARQLARCRVSIRRSVQERLQEIVDEASAARPSSRGSSPVPQGPPHRFYVFEGCRVSYQVNPLTRSVVVLKVRAESG